MKKSLFVVLLAFAVFPFFTSAQVATNSFITETLEMNQDHKLYERWAIEKGFQVLQKYLAEINAMLETPPTPVPVPNLIHLWYDAKGNGVLIYEDNCIVVITPKTALNRNYVMGGDQFSLMATRIVAFPKYMISNGF